MSKRTRAILINNPHNPTGRVLTESELQVVARLCAEFDVIAICDEVYEEMTFEEPHRRLAAYDGMWDRTITLSSLGKTFSLTGWKVGWAIAPPNLTAGLRSAHQYLTFTTPTPVQHGAVAALTAPETFYEEMRADYRTKRDLLSNGLSEHGFDVYPAEGTYFLMAGHGNFGFEDDRAFCRHLIEKVGVAAIPPSAFYHVPADGAPLVRFAFCKDQSTLADALDRISRLRP
jgi:aspartate/methionine/tyrosine aminotransferase